MNKIKILKPVKSPSETWSKLLKTYMNYMVKRLTRTMGTKRTTEMMTAKVSMICTRQVMSLTSLTLMRLLSSVSNSTSLKRTSLRSAMAPSYLKGRARQIAPKLLSNKRLQLDFASQSMTRGLTWMKQPDRGLETWSRLKEVQQMLSFKKKAKMFYRARQWECSPKRMPSNPKRTYRNRRTSTSEAKERQKMTLQKSWKIWRSLNSTKKKC